MQTMTHPTTATDIGHRVLNWIVGIEDRRPQYFEDTASFVSFKNQTLRSLDASRSSLVRTKTP